MQQPPMIMVVDDENLNLKIMEAILLPMGYTVVLAGDGEDALKKVRENHPDVILLDIMMPRMDGFEVVRQLKGSEETRSIPVAMVTALGDVQDRVKALDAGADDFLTKPVDRIELKARVRSLLKAKAHNDLMRSYQDALKLEVEQKTEQLRKAFDKIKRVSIDTVYRLAKAAEYKDEDTGAHIQRMSHFCAAIARDMGLSEKTVEAVLYASSMHDIGKIGIPDRILLKPGTLGPDEWEIMKKHTVIGGRILDDSSHGYLELAKVIALTHHEKWDGSGYPSGLKGAKIPLAGRITAVADVFDALTSKRPYKEAFPLDKSFSIIRSGSGSHFDPEVVEAFFRVQDDILEIRNRFKDEGVSLFTQMMEMVSAAESSAIQL